MAVYGDVFSSQARSATPCVKLDTAAFVADSELITALEQRSTPLNCEEDRILFQQGEEPHGLFVLHSGEVYLTMDGPDGSPVLCMQPFPGSLLGMPAMIGNKPYSLTARAQKGAVLSYASCEDFHKLLNENPTLPMKILTVLAAELRAARQALR